MPSNVAVTALCLIGAVALAACQPVQSAGPAAKPAESLTSDAPKPVAKVATASVVPNKAPAAIAGAKLAEAPKPVPANDEGAVVATITGCLVQDDGIFQLKDTDGEHAPKARSWKSGFIRKGSARIDIVDGNRLRMGLHIGHRVSVTGTLTDREMHARSMHATSERCD